MKNILFLRRGGVYLPEISAYIAYLRTFFPLIEAHDSAEGAEDFPEDTFDVVWKFMGFDRTKSSRSFVVHEYGSLSVGRFPEAKNLIKRALNVTPDLRVFLNDNVRQGMGFRDNVAYRLRDMGVSGGFFRPTPRPDPEFDFVYAGSLDRGRVIYSMLEHFKTRMAGAKLLVVGVVPDDLHALYGHVSNICFTGRLKYDDVPDAIIRARYGLNIMPDVYPFNIQTSTKVLEYCAAGLPVVSTDYRWIRDFERHSGGRFFYCDRDFRTLSLDAVGRHDFHVPDVTAYHWNRLIEKSGVFDFLSQDIKGE